MEISKIAQVALSKWKEYIKNKKYETEWEYVDKTPSKKYCYRDGFIDGYTFLEKENAELEAKDLIRNLLRVTYGEGWNYSLDVKVKAEQFLKENE